VWRPAQPRLPPRPSADIQEEGKKSLRGSAAGGEGGHGALEHANPRRRSSSSLKVLMLRASNAPTLINLLIEYREGRNSPGRDALESALKNAPEVRPAWLVLGVVSNGRASSTGARLAGHVRYLTEDARARPILGIVIGSEGWLFGRKTSAQSDRIRPLRRAHYNLAFLLDGSPRRRHSRGHYYKIVDLGGAPARREQKIDAAGSSRPTRKGRDSRRR